MYVSTTQGTYYLTSTDQYIQLTIPRFMVTTNATADFVLYKNDGNYAEKQLYVLETISAQLDSSELYILSSNFVSENLEKITETNFAQFINDLVNDINQKKTETYTTDLLTLFTQNKLTAEDAKTLYESHVNALIPAQKALATLNAQNQTLTGHLTQISTQIEDLQDQIEKITDEINGEDPKQFKQLAQTTAPIVDPPPSPSPSVDPPPSPSRIRIDFNLPRLTENILSDLYTLENQILRLAGIINGLKTDNDYLEGENDALHAENYDLEQQVTSLLNETTKGPGSADFPVSVDYNIDIQLLTGEIGRISTRIKELQTQIEEFNKERTGVTTDMNPEDVVERFTAELEGSIQQPDGLLDTLKEFGRRPFQNDALESSTSQILLDLGTLNSQILGLEETITGLDETVAELTGQKETLARTLNLRKALQFNFAPMQQSEALTLAKMGVSFLEGTTLPEGTTLRLGYSKTGEQELTLHTQNTFPINYILADSMFCGATHAGYVFVEVKNTSKENPIEAFIVKAEIPECLLKH